MPSSLRNARHYSPRTVNRLLPKRRSAQQHDGGKARGVGGDDRADKRSDDGPEMGLPRLVGEFRAQFDRISRMSSSSRDTRNSRWGS